ncbi:Uncharacterized protein DBV15_10546 [Temnothorax longispinosus]|uniref:Uncharacterized protein n=1 Tax=Temnothorax longispinosus TaxID=300112 RepID=A0A4S2L193_9HYME|nr:Uncharacterized protein DBV15_10546 [Temnothorax longispinosus]
MPVMLTTSKQIMAYPGLRLPKGYLVATTGVYTPEPSSEYYTPPVTSLCYGLCHTNSSFNLSGERRRTSYPMERSLDERHPQDWLLFDHHKRETLASVSVDVTFMRNRVWQKDNRRCKLMVYTERQLELATRQLVPPSSAALKAPAGYSGFSLLSRRITGAYTFQAVSLVSAKLSRLLPRSINGQFCLLGVAIIEI